MAIVRVDEEVTNSQGVALAGAVVTVYGQGNGVAPLTSLARVYSDLAGTPAKNPQYTDGFGEVALYLDNTQLYTITFAHASIGTLIYPDQNPGASSSGTGNQFLNEVPAGAIDGTNVAFALTLTPSALNLYKNGLFLTPGLDYTMTNNQIALAAAPAADDKLFAHITY
ncbi:MAG: hypothetical protein ACRYGG_19565 [Janthinobacterium lividum]